MSFEIAWRDWPGEGGALAYGEVPWDARLFGFPVWELRANGPPAAVSESLGGLLGLLSNGGRARCLAYCKVPSEKVAVQQELVRAGFYPVEAMIKPMRDLRAFAAERRFERLRLREARPDDRAGLIAIAESAFAVDRYHLDPHVPRAAADRRFVQWIENGLSERGAMLAYEDSAKGSLLGFCYLKDAGERVVDLSLAALGIEAQKAGFGATMYADCLLECRRRGYEKMLARISISNVPVLNVFASLGFLFYEPMTTLHWYAPGG